MNDEINHQRAAAEEQYSITAHDYVSNPIGSRDWTIYWRGWQAAVELDRQQRGEAVKWQPTDDVLRAIARDALPHAATEGEFIRFARTVIDRYDTSAEPPLHLLGARLAYGYLFHIVSDDPRIRHAFDALAGALSRDEKAAGIQEAKDRGARTSESEIAAIDEPKIYRADSQPAEPVVNQSLTTDDAATGCVREALEAARNGLQWYRDSYPDAVDGSDDEADELIDRALAALAQPTVKKSLTVDDWKLMPKEYTEAMEHAGVKALEHACETLGENLSSESMVGVVYNAMYAAQPTTQQSLQDAEPMKCVACEGKPAPENNPCGVCGMDAEPVKVPRTAELLLAIQRYADERASMTKAHCTSAADSEQRDASDRTAQAYSDMCVMLARYGAQPAASAEHATLDLQPSSSMQPIATAFFTEKGEVAFTGLFDRTLKALKAIKKTRMGISSGSIDLYPAPVAAQPSVPRDATERFMADVAAELVRARTKFPGDRIMTIALAEEFGELAKAMLDEPGTNVWKEAVQTAVMAARVAVDGDNSVDEWRASKGLDNHRNGGQS